MIKIEKVLQKILKTTNIPPSIIYESRLTSDHIQKNPKALTDILVCPKCNGKLDFKVILHIAPFAN
jgi:hypothetical protein